MNSKRMAQEKQNKPPFTVVAVVKGGVGNGYVQARITSG
jgi:hypothetical protein